MYWLYQLFNFYSVLFDDAQVSVDCIRLSEKYCCESVTVSVIAFLSYQSITTSKEQQQQSSRI